LIETESEISKILFSCPNKQSDSDPIPTWLLKVCASVLTPIITNIVNLSLSSGQFHPILKESVISPLLEKPTVTNTNSSTTGQSPTSLSILAHLQTALKHIYSCLQIFLLLTLPRLNFSSLVLNSNFLKWTTLHSIPLTLHATLVLSLMKILLSLIRSHHFLSPAILIFVSSAVSVLTVIQQPEPLLPLLSTLNLTTVTPSMFLPLL